VDYYESVVINYLRADRAVFVNTECCIQLNPGNPDTSGPHWYSDAVAVDFKQRRIFLCEISYNAHLVDLAKRLKSWHENWAQVCSALKRDCNLPENWPVRPWLFVPEKFVALLLQRLEQFQADSLSFSPLITTLEMVQPWCYRSWNRIGEVPKPSVIPEAMQA
jgi:hypothetical protein